LPVKTVDTAIVAAKPLSLSFTHLIPDDADQYAIRDSDGKLLGRVAILSRTGYVELNREILFDVSDIFEASRVIVLTTRIGNQAGFSHTLSGSWEPCMMPAESVSPLFGMSHYIQDTNQAVLTLIREEPTLQSECETILNFWDYLSKILKFEINSEIQNIIMNKFKIEFPLNKQFPLYS
jgi:hypothetical protein